MTGIKVDSSQLPLTDSLKAEVEALSSLHLEIVNSLLTTFDKAIELGDRLIRLKDRLPHGKFIKFVETHFTVFTVRTAQNYMKLYLNRDELRANLDSKLEVGQALRYLTHKKKENNKSTAIEEQTHKTINEHTKKLNLTIGKFNRLNKVNSEKALNYFNNNKPEQKLLLEAIEQKLSKTSKTVEKTIEQIDRMIATLRKKKVKLNKTKKEKAKLESIELLFKDN